jgi:Ca2+/Na+ antiporter
MTREELLSIFLVAGFLGALKVAYMANVSWWTCIAVVSVYVLLLVLARMVKKDTST